MSSQLYETVALGLRYLFALLGVLAVVRAFLWLFSLGFSRREARRNLPDAGTVGEFVVLSGGPDLPEGLSIPVPWEGILGSVRSCDVWVPGAGVRRQHLFLSYEPSLGLLARPFRGCEAVVNEQIVDHRDRPENSPLVHGSFLSVGGVMLRLRIFAVLDPRAGFEPLPAQVPSPDASQGYMAPGGPVNGPERNMPYGNPGGIPDPAYSGMESVHAGSGYLPPEPAIPQEAYAQAAPLGIPFSPASPEHLTESPESAESGEAPPSSAPASRRRRRGDRWEADWSE